MTDLMFNDLLDAEVRDVHLFYQDSTSFEPYEYMRVAGDGPADTAISFTEVLNPGDRDLVATMRKRGATVALKRSVVDPLAIFVVQAGLGIRLDDDVPAPVRVISIYGITNDGRYNLAVLAIQEDEDGRIYAMPTDVFHWAERPANFIIDVLPYLEFFRVNDSVREKVLA